MDRVARLVLVLVLALAALLPAQALARTRTTKAEATLINQAGEVVGSASFRQKGNSVTVKVKVNSGLTAGQHGIHVHAVGACTTGTTPPFASAGPHFNPTGEHHGHHAGDLGNVTANRKGKVRATLTTTHFTLSAGSASLFDADGSALMIHAMPDDGVTDPAGNSGGRVLCGVVRPK
jgi:Cu-Zn family superoxide dismutase